ncbi:MAG: acetyl-CoA carboxylase carboxyltransferase subunit alpha/beta [Actinomadura sp.]
MTAGAREVIARVLDAGSFVDWGTPTLPEDLSPEYAEELAAARRRSGVDEAVLVGEGLLKGRRVAVVVGEFAFLAGSVGVATARLLTDCIARATAERLPLLAFPVSGGTRMQEGTLAFVQMARVTAALAAHRRAGLPYLVWLRSPTFGGVLASWGSLGHVTMAEPGAKIGFLGPRVYRALYGQDFPADVQTAENLYAHGLLDAVLPLAEVRETVARTLDVLCAPRRGLSPVFVPDEGFTTSSGDSAWDSVQRTRRLDRPGAREVLWHAGVDPVELSGTGHGETGPAIMLGLARVGRAPCVIVAQDRHAQHTGRPIGPADLRVARRGTALAQELGLPLVTLVDTPGGDLSRQAEEGGMSMEIASCLLDLASTTVPTVSVLLGQGTGGAALALAAADRTVAARHAWLSPLPPEGASAIVHRTTGRAAAMAESQGIRSTELARCGIVDRVVDERPDAADEPAAFSRRLLAAVEAELLGLLGDEPEERLSRRFRELDEAVPRSS